MLSVVIPVLNQHEMTYECIQSLRECTTDFEIILIDNGSVPPIEPPFSGFVDIKLLRNEENLGFPAAVNQGIDAAVGDVICLLNNDVIVTPGWADTLIGWLDTFDICGPLTNYCAGSQRVVLPTYTTKTGLYDAAVNMAKENGEFAKEVNFIIGFCMMFKASLIGEIGDFDDSLWPCSGEEIDFCFRAVEAGKKIGVAVDCYVHHFGSQTFQDMENAGQINYMEIVNRNDAHLAKKWGNFWERQDVVDTAN